MILHRKILLVEDDHNLAYLLSEHLNENNFDTTLCSKAQKAINKLDNEHFDLCLLDILLPDIDGIELAREIKKRNTAMPIVFLTSRNLKSDKKIGYEIGCDDYITKPFDSELLVMKINAILKRCYGNENTVEQHIEIGDCKLDLPLRKLTLHGVETKLSITELKLLREILSSPSTPVSRDRLMKSVWGKSDYFISKNLDVYIARLRKILKPSKRLKLETIHAYGYVLVLM